MVKGGCLNGENMDTSKYAAPMPVIGLYIAFATLVCFVTIVLDIFNGFRRRKLWLPCTLFSVNSFTLTILSIALKLPVDLNTPMPTAIDQLAKLTSNGLLCIFMGFSLPSLGTMRMNELFANLAALSILAITTIVNMCIQFFTGVVFAFVVEHVITMFCMLALLVLLWSSSLMLYSQKSVFKMLHERLEECFRPKRDPKSMRIQLRGSYTLSSFWNPQLLLSHNSNYSSVGVLCLIVAVVVLETAVRSLVVKGSKFCNGTSDYKWSIEWVVLIQVLTILVGSFAIIYRWLILVSHMSLHRFENWKKMFEIKRDWYYALELQRIYRVSFEFFGDILNRFFKRFMDFILTGLIALQKGVVLPGQLVLAFCLMVRKSCSYFFEHNRDGREAGGTTDSNDDDGFAIAEEDDKLLKWINKIVQNDFERLASKKAVPSNLIQLLSKDFSTSLQPQSLLPKIKDLGSPFFYVMGFSRGRPAIEYRITCLSLVAIAKIYQQLLPSRSSSFLLLCLKEVEELIFFGENKKIKSLEDELRLMSTKDEWESGDTFGKYLKGEALDEQHDINCVGEIIMSKFREVSPSSDIRDIEFKLIIGSIFSRRYESAAQMFECIELTFWDMAVELLTDLPHAILIECYDGPVEEIEERSRRALKIFFILESLGDKVPWPDPPAELTFSLFLWCSWLSKFFSFGNQEVSSGSSSRGSTTTKHGVAGEGNNLGDHQANEV